jgi:hypothetical protein
VRLGESFDRKFVVGVTLGIVGRELVRRERRSGHELEDDAAVLIVRDEFVTWT